jgi:hypothetical protein
MKGKTTSMKFIRIKRLWFSLSSVFILLIHLPFVFAKNRMSPSMAPKKDIKIQQDNQPSLLSAIVPTAHHVYDSLRLNLLGLSRQAFDYALRGFDFLTEAGKITNDHIISIIDYSKSSAQKRFFVINLKEYKVLFNTYVAHGVNSGIEYATQFSNAPQSNKSSLGFFKTGPTYMGKNGYSLKLEGLERGFNDNAFPRDIVMHGAPYVNRDYIHSQGYIGRSWGCPAVAPNISKPIIDQIKNGTCIFIYGNDSFYLHHSRLLQG